MVLGRVSGSERGCVVGVLGWVPGSEIGLDI